MAKAKKQEEQVNPANTEVIMDTTIKPESLVDAFNQQADKDGLYGRARAVKQFVRDEHGLLKHVNYVFNEDGSVDYKKMIPTKYLVVNSEYFEKRQMEIPTSVEGLDDKQMLVLLGGIKELAKIRGIKSVSRRVVESGPDRAVIVVGITFIGNYETGGIDFYFEETANATLTNTNEFSQLFLETIASNRAFVRTVRNALRIDIVGTDELATIPRGNAGDAQSSEGQAWAALKATAERFTSKSVPDGFKTFDSFKEFLRDKMPIVKDDGTEWQDWSDIQSATIFKLLSKLNGTIRNSVVK